MCSDLSSNTSMPEQCRMKETINFGVIGCGSISVTHIAALAEMKDVRVVAVSDANASRRTNAAGKTGARAMRTITIFLPIRTWTSSPS